MNIDPKHLNEAISEVLCSLNGITDLYPIQMKLLETLFISDNIFFTASTNSGKTLPVMIYPLVLNALKKFGYSTINNPKILFVTALNSLQLSLLNNVRKIGINCLALSSTNIKSALASPTPVLFISPEVLKVKTVTQSLLSNGSKFVLKVVDEAHLGKLHIFS